MHARKLAGRGLHRRAAAMAAVVALLLTPAAGSAAEAFPFIERIDVNNDGEALSEDAGGDGRIASTTSRFVTFRTKASLVGSDTNDGYDVYVRDLQLDTTELVSVGLSGTAVGGFDSSISSDGCRVAFSSGSNNLVTEPPEYPTTYSRDQPFVRDRCTTPPTTRVGTVRRTLAGTGLAAISGNGRHVLVTSTDDLSVPQSESAGCHHPAHGRCLFVQDLVTAKIARVDVSSDGAESDLPLAWDSSQDISASGRFVIFAAPATNLVPDDTNGEEDVFVHDRDADADGTFDEPGQIETSRISVTSTGQEVSDAGEFAGVAISGNGKYAAFSAWGSQLTGSDPNPSGSRIFVRNLSSGALESFGRPRSGTAAPPGTTYGSTLEYGGISDDGRTVAFMGFENWTESSNPARANDAWIRNLATGVTIRVTNHGYDTTNSSYPAGLAGNGRLAVILAHEAPLYEEWVDGRELYAAGVLVLPPKCNGLDVTDSKAPFVGGPGRDVMLGTSANEVFAGNDGDDVICGGGGNDKINGGPGKDKMFGMAGDDTLLGGGSNDRYDGGGGIDTAVFGGSAAISLDLGLTSAQTTGQGSDTFVGVENATGSSAADVLTGNGADNLLSGSGGNDTLSGRGGADQLRGNEGKDTLGGNGGAGDDCNGGADVDKYAGGSKAASGCETATSVP